MTADAPSPSRRLLRSTEFRALLGARGASDLAMTAVATVVGFQVWDLTHDPLALGWIGLVEAIPALGLSLYGGHVADRRDRRSIVLMTGTLATVAVVLLGLIALNEPQMGVLAIYLPVFIVGIAGGIERPALTAFEMQVVRLEDAAPGTSLLSSVSETGAIAGPAVGGILLAFIGVAATYLILAVLLAVSVGCIALVSRQPTPVPKAGESLRESLSAGIRYVFHNQYLVGSMALDLFAVLFGGVTALLPAFADQVLHVGPIGLGLLRTAPSVGALLVMIVATRHPPTRAAGPILLACVAGFGVSMIVFGLSTSFLLSLVALLVSGVTDGVSMIIRSLIVRVMSPEHIRGRVSSVSWVFIGASNQIGAFESGIAASLLGLVPSVVAGGVVTLGVVGIVAIRAPLLRRLDLRETLKGAGAAGAALAAAAVGDAAAADVFLDGRAA